MKNLKIFLLLILLIQVLSLSENKDYHLEENDIIAINMTMGHKERIDLPNKNGTFNLTIVALKKDVKITIENVGVFSNLGSKEEKVNFSNHPLTLIINDDKKNYFEFSVSDNCKVEISGVLKKDVTDYLMFDYKIDSKIEVERNNFVIFLDDSNPTEIKEFEMKFKFKDIKNQNGTFGFLYLPLKGNESLVLGKHYNKDDIGNKLEKLTFTDNEFQLIVNNSYYKGKMSKPENKNYFAFIFSIDKEDKLVGNYYFTINSEIINLFLIISIVVALVFAVITFFLIRRKQATEGTSITGEESKDEQKTESDENNNNKEVSSEN